MIDACVRRPQEPDAFLSVPVETAGGRSPRTPPLGGAHPPGSELAESCSTSPFSFS